MTYFLLLLAVVFNGLIPVIGKQYNTKALHHNSYLYTSISNLFIAVFFLISAGFRLELTYEFLLYSIGFGIANVLGSVGLVCATKTGSLSLTSLIMAYSLIIPTFYGIIFLEEPVGIMLVLGIIVLLVSLFLINMKKGDTLFSPIWLLFMTMAFIGNGGCSVIQKMEQLAFDGAYKNEFMFVAALFSMVLTFVIWLFDGKKKKAELREAAPFAVFNGIVVGAMNLAIMFLTGLLPNAILFPSVSAGGIVVAFLIATFVYKEKINKTQLAGYIAGFLSVILLNL